MLARFFYADGRHEIRDCFNGADVVVVPDRNKDWRPTLTIPLGYKCLTYGCPERVPVKRDVPPRCYTCGQLMPQVPMSVFDPPPVSAKIEKLYFHRKSFHVGYAWSGPLVNVDGDPIHKYRAVTCYVEDGVEPDDLPNPPA